MKNNSVTVTFQRETRDILSFSALSAMAAAAVARLPCLKRYFPLIGAALVSQQHRYVQYSSNGPTKGKG
jgi:hypothetical protein